MSDNFFYDLNKKMADLAQKQTLAETAQAAPVKPAPNKLMEAAADYSAKKAAAGKDIGKPGKNFSKIAAGAAKRYGSAEAGKRVAGAVLNKLRHPTEESVDESAFQAAIGKKKYGDQGMKALQKAGRDHASNATMNKIRNRYDKYDESMTDEGNAFSGAVVNAKKDGIQPGEKISVGGKQYKLREEGDAESLLAKYSPNMHDRIKNATDDELYSMAQGFGGDQHSRVDHELDQLHKVRHHLSGPEGAGARRVKGVQDRFNKVMDRKTPRPDYGTNLYGRKIHETDATPQDVESYKDPVKAANAPQRKASAPVPPPKKTVPPPTKKPAMYPANAIDEPVSEGGMPMTPKQKKFASLAKPFDKITFADKIVGAKKEVDEMLGDVAATAMKKAVRGRNRDMEESFLDDEPTSRRSSTGGRIDTSEPGVTRHRAVKGNYSGAAHDASTDDEPTGMIGRRKVGAGMGKKIGAKINRGTSKLMTDEDMIDPQDQGEYDQEGEMAKDDIKTVVRHAQALEKILGDNDNLPEWVQAKLAKIEGMMTAVDDYMQNQKSKDMGSNDQEMDEERTGKRDNRAERAGRKVAKDIEYDEKKKDGIHGKRRGSEDDRAEKAGKKVTKDIEYDEKKNKKKEVDETTTSGSVATGGTSSKGQNFGKGIYDSLNRQLENMISESMNINMSMNNDEHGGPRRSLTVTATDDDAVMLAGLLKMAGMGQDDEHIHAMTGDDMHAMHDMDHDHGDEPCPDCGMTDCGCDDQMMDEAYGDTDATENEPDYPTDEEGTDDAMMYSGGLNGPKSTGQTTVPVIAHQRDRMGHDGDSELRRMMEIAGLR
jgi:hypothetical protein